MSLGLIGVFLGSQAAWSFSLETIRDRGILHIGVKTNLFPMGFQDEQGNLAGFEIELARQIAQELMESPNQVKLIPLNNRDRLQAVAEGRVDLVIASMTATESRRRWVDFTSPYYFERTAIVLRDRNIASLRALRGSNIAVVKASSAIEALNEDDLDLKLVEVNSGKEALNPLQLGQVRAIAGDRVMLLDLMRQDASLYFLKDEFGLYPMSIALPKGVESASLRSAVNQALQRLQGNGWLRSQWTKWNLDP